MSSLTNGLIGSTRFRNCAAATAIGLWLVGTFCFPAGIMQAAQQEPDDPLVQMIVELVSDADRDMRALGLQQVREEVPGRAATERFVALLSELEPDGQAALVEALGERGDASARPAILEMLQSPEEAVRTAVLRALGGLGSEADVPLLAEKAAAGGEAELAAARQSLVRLKGEGVNEAVVAVLSKSEPTAQAVLLDVLAGRNAKGALPSVIQSVKAPESNVRQAALDALRYLADETQTSQIIEILKTATDDADRRKAELALLVVCSRGRQMCADAIIAGISGADPPTKAALVRALARAGGQEALEAVTGCLQDQNEAVRDEAVRMMSIWPDSSVRDQLLELAADGDNLRYQVLAIRGLVRLASPGEDKPADLETLAKVMELAGRPQEKRLVLGTLGDVATPGSLALVASTVDDTAIAEEAGLAAVTIVEKMEDGNRDQIRAALEKVRATVKGQQLRQRVEKILAGLE